MLNTFSIQIHHNFSLTHIYTLTLHLLTFRCILLCCRFPASSTTETLRNASDRLIECHYLQIQTSNYISSKNVPLLLGVCSLIMEQCNKYLLHMTSIQHVSNPTSVIRQEIRTEFFFNIEGPAYSLFLWLFVLLELGGNHRL